MTSPSKVGAAFLAVFGLPFLGMGLMAAFSFAHAANQSEASRIAWAGFASVFAVIGAGLIFGGFYGYARQKRQAQKEMANPSSPWLWRDDWAASRVESRNKSSAIGWWVAAVLLNLLLLPFCVSALPELLRMHDPKLAIPVGFELIGLMVLAGAIRATIRLERFGKTYFEMYSLPFSAGGRVAGAIHLRLHEDAPRGVNVNLLCVRRTVIDSGKNSSTHQLTLWEASKNVPASALSRGPVDSVVPVEFAIPADALQTDHDNPRDQVLWLLKATASMPGVDYADEFELPVFGTALPAARDSFATSRSDNRASGPTGELDTESGTIRLGESGEGVAEPAQHRVAVNTVPDGLEFYFGAGRNHARALLVVALAAGITLLLWWMTQVRPTPPVFALAVVVLLDFALLMAFVHSVLSTTRIVAGNGVLRWRHAIVGIGKAREVQISEIESILPFTSLQQAGSSGSALYSIRLLTKAGKRYTLVDDIESRQEARWVVSTIEARLGLRADTRVEISGGIYGAPPQPFAGQTNPAGSLPGGFGKSTPRNTRVATVLGGVVFGLSVGLMAHAMLRNMAGRNTRSNGTRGVTDGRAAGEGFVRSAETRQASLQEVLSWPAQKQAEELMARCADHDTSALKAFEESVPNWVGKIHLSDNLRQLEDRASYSSDLRVRRAEADLELTLDGWAKTPNSVDLLMDRVKTDKNYRPTALYFLGMLAGDGIETDRAHAFVVSYARSDADPLVRQWATEGLRFIGTDSALDELFEIFTHDPAMSVRDRAGCNISDCGIFERKQRLAMVPRLIDLAAAPETSAQMRNWCFLALQEISDENLPPYASAWRRWYEENADRKRAQFEALDWWQVRGDS